MPVLKTQLDVWDRIVVGHPGECWPILGSVTTKGYGTFNAGGRRYAAHRLTYELLRGSIPVGLVLDHVCRTPRCCNPFHLEAVTSRVNSLRDSTTVAARNARKTHCPQGHEYSGDNVRIYRGGRYCRACYGGAS